MNLRRTVFSLVLVFLTRLPAFSQLTVTQGTSMNMTPQQLVQSQLVGQGITVSNATFNGSSAIISSNQIGFFTTSGTAFNELKINAGLLMTSGAAANAIGPNNTCGKGSSTTFGADPDLNILAGVTTNDKCVLEFDFVPQSDTLYFRYEFASEELFQYCNSYNDAFGFFLSGPGITGTFSNNSVNIALMPGSLNYVTINNICADVTACWCNAPVLCPKTPQPPAYEACTTPLGGGINFQYNAFTYVFTAWHALIPCSTYHIKLAIADASDKALDSGVFLEKNSFSATGLTISNNYTVPGLGLNAIEGCSDAIVSFTIPEPLTIPYTVNYTIGGTAINGVDYTQIPDSVVIQAGNDSVSVTIHPFMDGLTEGTETVVLHVVVPSCLGNTIYDDTIRIHDNFLLEASLGNDTSGCQGTPLILHAQPFGGQPVYQYQWSNGSTTQNITISPPVGTYSYSVTVTEGCGASDADTLQVTIQPLPLVTNTQLSDTVCSGTLSNVPLQSSLPGSTFSWTAFCSSPFTTGYSPGTGSVIAQTLTNTGNTIDTVIYTIHAIAAGCPGPNVQFLVKVPPVPQVSNTPMQQTICSGKTSIPVNLTSNVSGASFTWTASATPGTTGYSLNGTSVIPAQTLVNISGSQGVVTYHIIPASPPGIPCPGQPADYKIYVNPLPVPIITGNMQVCAQQSGTGYSTPNIPGNTYSWSVSGGTIAGGAGTNAITVNWGAAGNGTVKVIETITSSGCRDSVMNTVTINPLPIPVISGPSTPCEFSTQIYSTPSFAGRSYTWSVTGGTIQMGQGTSQVVILWGAAGMGSVGLTETIVSTGCSANAAPFPVTIRPYPLAAGAISGPDTVCEATANQMYTTGPITYATSYDWNYSGTGVTIVNNGRNATLAFALGATSGNLTVKGVNSCGPGPAASFPVYIKPVPYVSFTLCNDPVTILSAQPFVLKGGVPYGGTFSGPGVSAGLFNPSAAGVGTHTITFSWTASWGCANTATRTISILSPPAFACGNTLTDIRDNTQYPTVSINGRCWIAGNLNYGTQVASSVSQRDNCVTEKYCFNDASANCMTQGGLYQWDELMQYGSANGAQGICPPGWHVPTEAEWNALFNFYISSGFAGSALKSTGFSGFDAFLNGVRFRSSVWSFSNFATFFWSSTSHGPKKAWAHGMNSYVPSVSYYPSNRDNAFPVRCIRD